MVVQSDVLTLYNISVQAYGTYGNLFNHHSANNASYTNLTELQSCFSIRNTFVIQLDKCIPTRSQARLSYAAGLLNIYTTT